jgi:hypothetical protein
MLEHVIRQGMHSTRKGLPEWFGGASFQLVNQHLLGVFFGGQALQLRSFLERGFLLVRQLNDQCHGGNP